MKKYLTLMLIIGFLGCQQNDPPPQNVPENFVINRVLIVNEKNEILMIREQSVWATPSYKYSERQYVKESVDSLANAYGVKIDSIKLHGQFSFKYDYQPYATLRNYYVAKYVSGDLKIPEGMAEVKWLPSAEAIEINTVTAIKQITEQIIKNPTVVWGGSFMVSHVGDDHPTKQVEPFYPLFENE